MNTSAKRNNKLLFKKMLEYLFPTMLTMAALSLDEFVDSMIVSNLLGSNAMAVVGLGSPITMCIAATHTLLGSGGSTLYALSLGKRDNETAGKALRVSVLTALFAGLAVLLAGFVFFDPLTSVLCKDASLLPAFRPYLRGLLMTAPFVISILTLVEFLPPSGAPKVAMAINLIANIFNMVMDYVYIKVFGLGVEGAAYATVTGYALGAVLIAYVVGRRKITIPKARVSARDFRLLGEVAGIGSPSAVSQLGFALKFAFCNNTAILCGGAAGVVAYSLCNQTLSIVSIFLAALVGASMPLIAVLHGQRDFGGENNMLKSVMRMNAVLALVCFVAFQIFAKPLTALYNINGEAEVALAVRAVRIFALMYVFRGFYMIMMKYLQAMSRKAYSMFISVFDGFAGIIPIVFVLSGLMGLDGLWWAFPVTSAVLLLIVLLINRRIAVRSNGHYTGWLMAAHEDEAEEVFDVTLFEDGRSISAVSEELQQFCVGCGLDARSATHSALCVEEMAVYTRNRHKKNDYMDVLARLYADKIEIDFRSLGDSFDPLVAAEGDVAENIRLLHGIASKVEYSYIMGMNCTRITIARKGAAAV